MRLAASVDGGGAHGSKEAGIGVTLVDRDSGVLLFAKGMAIGDATNNEAEYSAVLLAVLQAVELGCEDLIVRSDSKLIVNQLNGEWRLHENHLKDYHDQIQVEIGKFQKFVIEWIPRAANKIADSLARQAVNTAT